LAVQEPVFRNRKAYGRHGLAVADTGNDATRLTRSTVENLVGKGLFEVCGHDGPLGDALLQQVSDVAVVNPRLLVLADTYIHKIKLIHLNAKRVTTLVGTGESGNELGDIRQMQLNEPAGVAVMDNRVLVAGTDNRRILIGNPLTLSVAEWTLIRRLSAHPPWLREPGSPQLFPSWWLRL